VTVTVCRCRQISDFVLRWFCDCLLILCTVCTHLVLMFDKPLSCAHDIFIEHRPLVRCFRQRNLRHFQSSSILTYFDVRTDCSAVSPPSARYFVYKVVQRVVHRVAPPFHLLRMTDSKTILIHSKC
jgi:hypothetical protein